MHWFKIGKGVHQGCILLPCLIKFYAEYIMWNSGLDESQAGIKIAGKNISNLRYADDTTLMVECQEKLKSFLMRIKEETSKAGLKLTILETMIIASSPNISWQIDEKKVETVTDFIFFSWVPKTLQMLTADMKLKDTCSSEGQLWQTWTAY